MMLLFFFDNIFQLLFVLLLLVQLDLQDLNFPVILLLEVAQNAKQNDQKENSD